MLRVSQWRCDATAPAVIDQVSPDNREIGGWIVSDNIGRELVAIRKRHLDLRRIVNDTAVRKNQPVGSKYKSQTAALPLARLSGATLSPLHNINLHN